MFDFINLYLISCHCLLWTFIIIDSQLFSPSFRTYAFVYSCTDCCRSQFFFERVFLPAAASALLFLMFLMFLYYSCISLFNIFSDSHFRMFRFDHRWLYCPMLLSDNSMMAAGVTIFVFGYFLNKCIMSSAMVRRYSFITYLFLQMCTWHACLFPASGIRPSYTRHLISCSRHCFFMIFIRSWCHMGLLLYSSHSSPHGHMRTLYITKYFQSFLSLTVCYLSPASVCGIFLSCCQKHDIFHKKTNFRQQAWSLSIFFYVYHSWLMFSHSLSFLRAFTCFLYISSAIDIFGYFPCLLRYTVFCYVLTAAGSRSSFGYYHLSRQQPLLRLSACTSLLLFLLLSVIDDTSFLLHLILFHRNFACFIFFISFMTGVPSSLTYFATPSYAMYWLLPEVGLLFGYYNLSRQQLLLCFICMHCFSITYVWCAYSFRIRYLITYIWCFFFAHVDFLTVLIIRSAIFITYRCLSISGMETITLFLLSLIYDVFSNLSIIFTSLISDDFSFESGSRTHCVPYICGYFYLLYMMYIRLISSFISDNHLKIRWSTIPSCHVYCIDYCCWHCY